MDLESLDTETIKKRGEKRRGEKKTENQMLKSGAFFPGPLKAATEGVHLAQSQ